MGLVDRAKNILLTPATEWAAIDAETTSIKDLYLSYVAILAAIPPVASAIGYSVFGMRFGFGAGTWRWPISTGIEVAVMQYALSLAGVFLVALIVDALAPTFGGQKNQMQALKVVAYANTAPWVAGIFALVPGLRILGILGLYGLYLLYLGLPVLMKAPKDKAVAYTVVTVVCAIVVYFVIGAVVAAFVAVPHYMG